MDNCVLAYLAGALDSDGSFGIKRSTYHMRVRGDASHAVFSERIDLKQVTPEIPTLLRETFGGSTGVNQPGTPKSRPLYRWHATDKRAAAACRLLLPFLRIKRRQASLLLELRESKEARYSQTAYWFVQEYPAWHTMPMLTAQDAATILGYISTKSVYQAVSNGTLVVLPYRRHVGEAEPRIPRLLVERVAAHAALSKDGRKHRRPPELIAWRDSLYAQIRELNKLGVNGTSVYFRTGVHTPA